jgi:hypothetical protein
MIQTSSRWKVAVLLLALSLAASLTSAAELRAPAQHGPRVEAPSLGGLLDDIWQFLSARVWSKCGGSLDPDGLCKSLPPSDGSSKCGGSADPDGRCSNQPATPSASSNNGGSPDPNG